MGFLSSGTTKLSAVSIDADLVMGAHNITLGAGQTVDGDDIGEICGGDGVIDHKSIQVTPVASDTLKKSEDTEVANIGGTADYEDSGVVHITIPANYVSGTFRIKYDTALIGGGSGTFYTNVYKNGNPLSTPQSTTSTTYATKSCDKTLVAGDVLSMYCKHSAQSDLGRIENFRVYCTDTIKLDDAW